MTASVAAPPFIQEWLRARPRVDLSDVAPDPTVAAIFSADMIVGFCDEGPLSSPRIDALTEPVVTLFRHAWEHGIRHFLLMQDTHSPDTPEFEAYPPHCIAGTKESQTIPELAALPFADAFTIVPKNSLNPAIETTFNAWWDEHPDLRIAIVVGDCTDLCTYQLAMHLRMRANARNIDGFSVIVPVNAVDTFDIPEESVAKDGFPHPAAFFHEVFLYHLAMNGITVVAAIEGSSTDD